MRITATLQTPRINLTQYKKRLSEDMTAALTNAAFDWIQATTAKIPVWSGASHATFLHLSREIGFNLAIDNANNAPRRVSYGLRNSEGSFTVDANSGVFAFDYSTTLKHLIYNEYNNANITPDPGLFSRLLNPGPYQFQDAGREAFLRSVRGVTLPDLRSFIKVKVKRVR
jgi:hypothetical protein